MDHPQKRAKLGTFAGVFTPSVLTILGIILFLRLGYVVGNAGLARALIIIGVANLISVLTSFSLAAIATNMKVKGGGDYYLISRTLGIEFGGAIGIVLFLAQSISIAFYCIGFGEVVSGIIAGPGSGYLPQLIAGGALIFLFSLAWFGADLATKFQYVVMVFLVLALVSFYWGGIGKWDTQLLVLNWSSDGLSDGSQTGFWILFALFFPAVTGFTQGVSMSGDLKDTGKSLPSGTFAAVALSIIVYFSAAVIFAASSPLEALSTDYGIMKKTALFSIFIDAGVIAATLSSAMASFLGAPRILQSLSGDKIFPFLNPFAKGYGDTNNPRRAVLLSLIIASVTIALGQLDLIAGIVSMFFLISYGLLNYATYFEAAAQSPSFRPRFKWYNKYLSLLGFLACMGVMAAIDLKTSIAALGVLFAIFQYIKRSSTPNRWADGQRSFHLKEVRKNLLAAQKDLDHPREWRPHVLALANDHVHMMDLLEFSQLIEGKSGMTTAVQIIQGSGFRALKLKEKQEKKLKIEMTERKMNAFPLVVSAVDVSMGLSVLFQAFGIGPVRANTVLFNWNEKGGAPHDSKKYTDYTKFFRLPLQSGCNIILLDDKKLEASLLDPESPKTIDVWWKNNDTSRLMLLLAYLMTRNEQWESAQIRLLCFHLDQDNKETQQTLYKMLEEVRISAVPKIILGVDADTIVNTSRDSDLVFLPISLTNGLPFVLDDTPVEKILPGLRTVAMAIAARKIELDTEPEMGKAGELALLLDELKDADKRVEIAEKQAYTAAKAAKEEIKELYQEKPLTDDPIRFRLKTVLAVRDVATEANKKAMKERAKLIEVSEKAKEKGLTVDL